MDFLLKKWVGKIAIVTGASSGIGAAISEELVVHGVIVAGLARNNDPIEEMSKKLEAENCKGKLHSFRCDITDENEIIKTLKNVGEQLGPVSILINNAGVLFDCTVLNGSTEIFKQTFETNVISKCITTREVIKEMKTHNIAGQIININSVLGHHVYDIPNMNVYPASQFAVTALNETLRLELIHEKSKIKVTNLSPGPVDTKMFDPEKPLKSKITRFLKPNDVADAVIYILSTPPHVQVQELIIRPVGELH